MAELRKQWPELHPLPRVFIAFDTASDFEQFRGALYDQVAQLLTQLSESELRQLGGFEVIDPITRSKIFPPANA